MPEQLESTPVEQRLPAGEHGNIHHNVPRSRIGRTKGHNLSSVEIPRHNQFHRTWAANATPIELVRQTAVLSVGMDDPAKRLDEGRLGNILNKTRAYNWARFYEGDTLETVTDPIVAVRIMQNLRSTLHLLGIEKAWTADTIAAIRGEGRYPSEQHSMLRNGMEFFGVETPEDAIKGLLDERHKEELSWCKPMKARVREQLLAIVGTPVTPATNHRGGYVDLMTRHHRFLDSHEMRLRETITRMQAGMRELFDMYSIRPQTGETEA